jgi:hypothetical protein
MKEYDHDGRPLRIETGRNMQEHAVVAEGLIFPQDLPAPGAMTPSSFAADIEERPASGLRAVIWERRRIEGDKLRYRLVRRGGLGGCARS